ARFGGVGRRLYIPMKAIRALVAREYGVGVSFPSDEESVSDESGDLDGDVRPGESLGPRATEDGDQPPPESPDPGPRPGGRPSLRVVK
ncbi:MAG: stringent starvation protein B, partial [Chromatiales bacterium]|nr:stringent starvation protein B [Chromatiales bacterium]